MPPSPTTLRRRLRSVVAGGALGVLANLGLASAASAATYSGTLATAGVAWISDESKPAPSSDIPEMRNTMKTFVPDVLVITAGSTVRFPNDDPFFHSIYSDNGPDDFDIGFYDNGPGKTVSFPKPGVVNVRCHIHGRMHATIIVVDGPWAQTHGPSETFTLPNVRPGSHVVHTWTPESGERTTTVKF